MSKMSLPPGFWFHPTDEELVLFYLKRKVTGKQLRVGVISEVDPYKFAPWDLPGKSCLQSRDLEWYFFCPRDKKHANGSRRNRRTDIGYWKTTGKDRFVCHNSHTIGVKKILFLHVGRAPCRERTNWAMYEYKLEDRRLANLGISLDAYVLCRLFTKSGPGPKNGEQYGASLKEDEWEDDNVDVVSKLLGHTSWEEKLYHPGGLCFPMQSEVEYKLQQILLGLENEPYLEMWDVEFPTENGGSTFSDVTTTISVVNFQT